MMNAQRIFSFSLVVVMFFMCCNAFAEEVESRPLPEFTEKEEHSWLNSKPLSVRDLKGEVVLIDVWTYACWNCYRSFPWLNNLERDLKGKPFRVIGIHSPEFGYEKNLQSVKKKIAEFKLKHPVMIDNNLAYWRALQNNAWPSYYLVDKTGVIRGKFVGETHNGTRRDKEVRDLITRLLTESQPLPGN
jgi:thiol-disulfide isomerase/thioredoxin